MEIYNKQVPEVVLKYKVLVHSFLEHDISASDFKSRYLKMLKNESEIIGSPIFDVLEELFEKADDYVADPELRSRLLAEDIDFSKYGKPLDDEELRVEARKAYQRLFG